MGRYKFSRNEAENISRWGDYTIVEREDSDIIADRICVIKDGFFDKLTCKENYVESMWKGFGDLITSKIDGVQND